MQWTVRPYTPADEAEWDRFVMHESGNGTFLQTRNFLNYHPAGRFTDASLMVYNEHGGLGAVVPAALRLDGATRIFRSHPGSTFGGPVLRSTYNSAAKSIGILQAVEDYIATRYDAADFRPTPDLFNGVENVALQYAFTYLGYTQQTELSTWVPVAGRTPETLLASFRQNKKQDVKKALKQDLTFRKLETRAEIDAFHALLRQNLQKFGVEPVHTADELWEFKTSRLPDIAGFYGVFADEQMVASGMTFYFAQANVLHTQYLAADLSIRSYSPAAYLYYRMLCLAAGMGCNALSWGISTEERGKVLNFGLVESKEGYASCHAVNLGFTKTFSKKETNDAT